MQMKRGLLKDISIDELKHYREEGFSNAEIAKLCGVSQGTIYRYIGKQPGEISGRMRQEGRYKNETERLHAGIERMQRAPLRNIQMDEPTFEDVREGGTPRATIAVVSREVTAEGTIGLRYMVSAGEIEIIAPSGAAIRLSTDDAQKMIAEMQTVLRHTGEAKHRNQIWD